MVEMRLKSIKVNDVGERQFISLGEVGGPRSLTIVIGHAEAQAIDRFVKDVQMPRPMTHDLARHLIEAAGCTIERVDVTELRGGTFYAMIRLQRPDVQVAEVDARPSDAIALATALGAPIFVAESVLEEALSAEA